jgi:hypothetical protein
MRKDRIEMNIEAGSLRVDNMSLTLFVIKVHGSY